MNSNSGLNVVLGPLVWIIGAVVGLNLIRLGWTLEENGLSVMTGRLPYWDFTNLWGGGRMALEGHVDYLFDLNAYRAELRALLSPLLLDQEWSYPPSMLLIGSALAMLPIFPAYLLWNVATLAGLYLVSGSLDLPRWQRIVILFAPPVLLTVLLGQNGALTAALLLGGLWLAPRKPIAAGILLGLLTIKPHLGLLVPFCLMATMNWRAILSATATTLLLILLTAILFGWSVWPSFLTVTNPFMRSIMEAAYPQGYQMNAMTFFTLARSLGADLPSSYLVQGLAAAAAIFSAIWLWRERSVADHDVRVALTGILTLCATPYGYTYDAVPLAIAVVVLARRKIVTPTLLALGWLYPLTNHVIARELWSIGVLVPASIAIAAMIEIRRGKDVSVKPDPQSFLSETVSTK